MDNLPIKKPNAALAAVWNTLLTEDVEEGTEIELVIRISDKSLPVRDLSAFLGFIDGIYGRLSKEGIRSYSSRKHHHLEITQVRQGSWELVLEGVISKHHQHAELLVIIWLAVKYLPPAVQSIASSYREYEEGRLAREQRRKIRHGIESDELMKEIPVTRKKELTALLNSVYEKEKKVLHRVSRFIDGRLIDVFIHPKKRR